MIASAAVKIYDKRQNVIVTIPCHRHADAFQILRDFGYRRFIDYNEIAQGSQESRRRIPFNVETFLRQMRRAYGRRKRDGYFESVSLL